MRKRIALIVIALLFCFNMFTAAAFACSCERKKSDLQFGKDGKFRIMQISDIQDNVILNSASRNLIIKALQTYPVDLIVLTGDNIASGSLIKVSAKIAISQFMSIFEAFDIPVVMTFGNHDDENTTASKSYQLSCYEEYDCFIGYAGKDFNNGTLCTYNVPIYSSTDGSKMAANIWMIDSGTYNTENDLGGYACTSKAQIEWYKEKSEELENANGRKIPSLMFQHIVVPTIWDALEECSKETPGSVSHKGAYYKLPENSKGVMDEAPCPPSYDNGQFKAVKERGDVMAVFFGHDHVNTYELEYEGIGLINTPGATTNSYCSENLGVRLITLDENKPWSFETEVCTYFDLFGHDNKLARYIYQISVDSALPDIDVEELKKLFNDFRSCCINQQ